MQSHGFEVALKELENLHYPLLVVLRAGHSSLSASGLGFLALYLWRALMTPGSEVHVWRMTVAIAPAVVALGVAFSRWVDCRWFVIDL